MSNVVYHANSIVATSTDIVSTVPASKEVIILSYRITNNTSETITISLSVKSGSTFLFYLLPPTKIEPNDFLQWEGKDFLLNPQKLVFETDITGDITVLLSGDESDIDIAKNWYITSVPTADSDIDLIPNILPEYEANVLAYKICNNCGSTAKVRLDLYGSANTSGEYKKCTLLPETKIQSPDFLFIYTKDFLSQFDRVTFRSDTTGAISVYASGSYGLASGEW